MIRKILFSAGAIAATAAFAVLPVQPLLAKEQWRGLNGACETEFVEIGVSPGPQPELEVEVTGTCHYGHLGLTTCVANQWVNLVTFEIYNVGTCTAANGDQLFTSFFGAGIPNDSGGIDFDGEETYSGGTGRFVNAFGDSLLSGSAQYTSAREGVGSFTLRGRIAY